MRPLLLLLALLCNAVLLFGQAPVITSFTPASGQAGTEVTITGHHFSTTPADNIVHFGTLKATVLTASTTSLTVAVPPGATYKPISVSVNGLTAQSTLSFAPTFLPISQTFTAGSFKPAVNDYGGGDVAEADMDGDGYTDLMHTRFYFDEVRILRSTRNGFGFSHENMVWGATTNPLTVKAADLNGDGLPELVVLSYLNAVNVFKNKSFPGFVSLQWPQWTLAAGSGTRDFAVGDLDNDGKPDVVVTNQDANTISIFRNTSTAGDLSFTTRTDLATVAAPEGVAIGDIDGDGKAEIVVAGYSAAGGIGLFRNQSTPGTLTFDAPQTLVAGTFLWDVELTDIDGDGKKDLLATNSGPNVVSVFRNTSAGSVSFAQRIDLPTDNSPRGMAVADLNADGKPEIITANWFMQSTAAVLRNKSTAGTISFDPFITYPAGEGTGRVVVADLNRDSLPDIITANSQSNTISYLFNQNGVNRGNPSCATMIAPAQGTNIPHFEPTRFVWRKDTYSTGYQLKIRQGNTTVLDITTTDTAYEWTPPAYGQIYYWSVRPANSPGPEWACGEYMIVSCPLFNTLVNITAQGGTTFCSTDSVKLQGEFSGAYRWYRDGQPIAGATDNFLWVKTSGSYTARMGTDCLTEPSQPIVVTVKPAPAKPVLATNGPTGFCAGGSVQLTSSLDLNNQWFKDEIAISSANGISYTANASGRYYVRVANTTSGCYNYSDTIRVTANPLPATPTITAMGPATVCAGTQVQLQSSAASGNVWFKDNAPLGFGAQSAFVDNSGSYTVQVVLSGCSSPVSSAFAVTVNPIPATPTLNVTGINNICQGDSLKLESSAVSGNQWYKDQQPVANATNTIFRAKVAGTYSVKATQNGCTSGFSANAILQLDPLPAKPVITANASVLSTNPGYTGYKWFLNNAQIPGATTYQYTATQSGLYRVVVNQTNPCPISSDELNFVYTAVNDIEWQGYTITWFPNPVQDQLTLRVSQQTSLAGKVTVRVVDAQGRLRSGEQVLRPGTNQVSLAALRPGIYSVIVRNGQSEKAFKIMKAK
ncbi:FG-GAP-like repeat-containing protein [Paraflavitalea sp. CAU 1676]|uniref:FG-GAP-like repeat-containing protein n=1 Tax=Paraflavitalea sp. CAU 1676 TaxID=3032598 RepID=UPI0023D9B6ED|nr:FG-GAP-like repeat-containing protein [Paraflavitalea sp. CAU 1676]MDF2187825.1 FG-GAP-like repeat-containing protein [Paraflavitalea sp. CAU 1676]